MTAIMKNLRWLKFLIFAYIGSLFSLLLSVIIIPLVIQQRFHVGSEFIIQEETLETTLIIILFVVFYFILRGFTHTLSDHERAVVQSGEERSKLVSRLAETFDYIGIVNVELQEIHSILCGVEHFPQTKREFTQLIDQLAAKAMTVAGTPWVVIRIISRSSGQTVKEYNTVQPNITLPSATLGNREILDNQRVEGMKTIGSRQKNLNLYTVCILPTSHLSEAECIIISAITNQIEMFFITYRLGIFHQKAFYQSV
jgi:hypothetical protein